MDAAANAIRRFAVVGLTLAGALALTACNGTTTASKPEAKPALAMSALPLTTASAADAGVYKIGKPYKVAGKWYTPEEDPDYEATGRASWYGSRFHGRRTANGEVFDMADLTGAHPTLPLPSYARVTNLENGRSVVVRINDRGPYTHNRLIDVSAKTAEVLDFKHAGSAEVRVQFVGLAPADGDDAWLTTTVRNAGEPVAPTMVASTGEPPADASAAEGGTTSPGASSLAWAADGKPAAAAAIPPVRALVSGYRQFDERAVVENAFALFD